MGWYGVRFGHKALSSAVQSLPSAHRGYFDIARPDFGLDMEAWYPSEVCHALFDVVTSQTPPELVHRMTDEAARETMRSLMQSSIPSLHASLSSVPRYARVVNALFRLMYDSGRVHVTARAPRRHETVLTEWRGHHALMCRFNMMTQPAIYEHMGCRDVRVELLCVSSGAAACGSIVTWS